MGHSLLLPGAGRAGRSLRRPTCTRAPAGDAVAPTWRPRMEVRPTRFGRTLSRRKLTTVRRVNAAKARCQSGCEAAGRQIATSGRSAAPGKEVPQLHTSRDHRARRYCRSLYRCGYPRVSNRLIVAGAAARPILVCRPRENDPPGTSGVSGRWVCNRVTREDELRRLKPQLSQPDVTSSEVPPELPATDPMSAPSHAERAARENRQRESGKQRPGTG
jgi:hypothetical protein